MASAMRQPIMSIWGGASSRIQEQSPGKRLTIHIRTRTTVSRSFSGTTRVSPCQKNLLLDFMVQQKITEADTLTIRLGAAPSGLISDPPPSSPIFMSDALPATTHQIYPGSLGYKEIYTCKTCQTVLNK